MYFAFEWTTPRFRAYTTSMKTVSTQEMRELDRRTIEEFGTPGEVLMKRAGQGVAEIAMDVLEAQRGTTLLLIAGTGNNGGDVFAAASLLAETDVQIEVWICGSQTKIQGDAKIHLQRMICAGILPREVHSEQDLLPSLPPDLIVDGLLGTGSKGAPRGFMAALIDWMNLEGQHAFVLSIDLPSGLNGDTGIAEGSAAKADLTATIGLPKTGLIRPEALPYVGHIETISIGIPEEYKDETPGDQEAELIDSSNLFLPPRKHEDHKGTFGHVLLIGGSVGFTGAIAMAARAALRSGAGLVSVLTPREVYPIVAQAAGPEVMVHPFSDPKTFTVDFAKKWKKITAVLVGPGFGPHPKIIEQLLKHCKKPLVLDADALCVDPKKIAGAKCPVVLTPHPGEFERLFGEPVTDRWGQARAASDRIQQTVVLKGAGTVVAHPKKKLGINLTGNPGMATAGSGDVLAGILTALLGQGINPFDAATTAVYLHGLAGDIAAERMTQESLIATDIIDALPKALRALQAE